MVNVGSGDAKTALGGWSTTSALAAFFNRTKVFGIYCIAYVENTGRSDGVSETLKLISYVPGSCCRSTRTAVLVGQTQSNMSAPRATDTTKSSGYPYIHQHRISELEAGDIPRP